jgi:HPt (histidine-containing phosphotransfer) domain-containing protein
MKAALEAKNIQDFTIYAHGLKSACANIGAIPLSDMAAALEDAGNRDDAAFIEMSFKTFVEAAGSVRNAIDALLQREHEGRTAAPNETGTEAM